MAARGLVDGGGRQHEFVRSPSLYDCAEASQEMIANSKPSKSTTDENDRIREKAVQAWLHDISIRQKAIKQLARATLEHFYLMLNTHKDFGAGGPLLASHRIAGL